jgi:hypothetical protein
MATQMMIPEIPESMKKIRVKTLINALNLILRILDTTLSFVSFFHTRMVGSHRESLSFYVGSARSALLDRSAGRGERSLLARASAIST